MHEAGLPINFNRGREGMHQAVHRSLFYLQSREPNIMVESLGMTTRYNARYTDINCQVYHFNFINNSPFDAEEHGGNRFSGEKCCLLKLAVVGAPPRAVPGA